LLSGPLTGASDNCPPAFYRPSTTPGQHWAMSPAVVKFVGMVLSAAIMAALAGLLMRLVVG
jgi:hypothetical protein